MDSAVSSMIDILTSVMVCTKKHLNHLYGLDENLGLLTEKMVQLNALKSDVNEKVIVEEARLMVRTDQVDAWMQRVEARRLEVEQIIFEGAQHLEKRSFNYCFPNNCWSGYKLGKKVAKKLKLVEELKRDGVFEIVVKNPPRAPVQELPENVTVGLDSVFQSALNLLGKDDVQVLGLYGVGGVGKTTLLRKINNEFLKGNNDFDVVIWVVISNEVNMRSVQEAIRERLGLKPWHKSAPLSSRADDMFNALKTKKFLILLDDVWQEIDLLSIGIPLPNAQNKSKIVLTTRSLDVCGFMGAHTRIKVNSLNKDQSWNLFAKKVGPDTLTVDPQIPKLAKKVVEKCFGLPLVIITVGASMASKTNPREWQRAISDLSKCAAKFPGMEERVLHLLKFSYDKLPSPTDQVCFLFCALYPEDHIIQIDNLIYQWIGLGYIHGFGEFEEALNIGHGIIGTLKRTCLLENGSDDHSVKMHDVIRELALWIARECGREEGKVFVKSNHTLTEIPMTDIRPTLVQTISLISTGITHLETLPNCPNLSTFFAPRNFGLNRISDNFFLSMPGLKFLDLSNSEITKLPTSICELFELEFLDLSSTCLTSLPCKMSNLTKLKYISFFKTKVSIPHGMMMRFSNLEILRLTVPKSGHSNKEMRLDIDELRCLNKLKALHINISDFKDLEKFLGNPQLCSCARYLGIENCKEITFLKLTTPTQSSSHLCFRHFQDETETGLLNCIADDDDETEVGLFESLETLSLIDLPKLIISCDAHFRKLHHVYLHGCDAMVDLAWIIFIPYIQTLDVIRCDNLQEILSSSSSDKSGGAYLRGDEKTTFSNLKSLYLCKLPNLRSICSMSALPFPSLENLTVKKCPKLRRLPLDSNSASNTIKQIKGNEEWWNELQWKDETIKTSFAKFFTHSSTKHIDYLCALEDKLNQLKVKKEQLNQIKNDVNDKVIAAEEWLMERTSQVNGWMNRVDAKRIEVEEILFKGTQHLGRRYLNGCCPKNCWNSYKLGKKVVKEFLDIEEIKLINGVFQTVVKNLHHFPVQELPENFTVGLDLVFERPLNLLLIDDDIGVLGLYGIGGVGKTTLLKKINNEMSKGNNSFDIVIWVVISSEVNMGTVQDRSHPRKIGIDAMALDCIKCIENEEILDIVR